MDNTIQKKYRLVYVNGTRVDGHNIENIIPNCQRLHIVEAVHVLYKPAIWTKRSTPIALPLQKPITHSFLAAVVVLISGIAGIA